jgi:lysophospholipase L1-like esterase
MTGKAAQSQAQTAKAWKTCDGLTAVGPYRISGRSMAQGRRAKSPSQAHPSVRVTVERGQSEAICWEFRTDGGDQTVSVGSQGDWRVTAPGVIGIHVLLSFDGRALLASAPRGGAMVGSKPLGAEWLELRSGDELRFGFALLLVGGRAPAANPSKGEGRRPRKALGWILVGGIASLAVVVLALVLARPPSAAQNVDSAGVPSGSATSSALPTAPAPEPPAAWPPPATSSRPPALAVPDVAAQLPKLNDVRQAPAQHLASAPIAQTDPVQPDSPRTAYPQNVADRPIPRVGDQPWLIADAWREHHERLLQAAGRANAKVIFLGDSITEGWWAAPAYKEVFGKYGPVNLGIASDTTQNVLWRLRHGALDGTHPRVVVTMVGINNLAGGFSPQSTANGLRAIVTAIGEIVPDAKVLLLAVLPARQDASNPLRQRIADCNKLLQALARPGRVEVLDVGSLLLEPDGSISKAVLRDYLHPTHEGYDKLSRAIAPKLAELADG